MPSYEAIRSTHVELLKEMINACMDNTDIETGTRKKYLDYYISGVLALYMQWYRGVNDLSLDEIRDFACELIETDIRYLIRKKIIPDE
ncbi:MAG: hypothetical protein IKF68_01365 [Erysipelotrichaceae bacterium]|nr:hypothetical protein [Erysipelotrichaceae bacterium]